MILSVLDKILEKKFGSEWEGLELETLSLELGLFLDSKTMAMFAILKTLRQDPERILDDAYGFMRFVEVSNNLPVDPEFWHYPNVMELAFSIFELGKLVKDFQPTETIKEFCWYVMQHDGVVEPIAPFTFLKGKAFNTNGPTSPQTMAEHSRDIAQYVKAMYETYGGA